MKIGISVLPTERSIDIAILAPRVEELGFDSVWTPEQPTLPVHTDNEIPREWGDIVDPFVMLSRASAVTTNIKLGTAVVVVPEHSPILLAKRVASLDALSSGRFLFGVGVGSVPEEAVLLGSDFPRRWTQAREAVQVMKTLWDKEPKGFSGDYYSFPPVHSNPKPAQQPHPPILIGSKASQSFRRIVEWGDGWIPIGVTPSEVEHGRSVLNNLCDTIGRDPSSIEISVVDVEPDVDLIRTYANSGADRVIIGIQEELAEATLKLLEDVARKVKLFF